MAKKTDAPSMDDASELLSFITKVSDYLPKDERPDHQQVLTDFQTQVKESMSGCGEFRGCHLLPPFSQKSVEWQFDNWMPDDGDVLVATYPKTGTTWLREIVKHLLYKGDEKDMEISSKMRQLYAYIDCTLPSLQKVYKQLPLKKRIWATHLPSYCIDMERISKRGAKILYVMRNPKDQLLSWYHFRLKLPFFNGERMMKLYPTEWDDFFSTHVTGQQRNFNKEGEWYPQHILSWYPHRNDKNVKFLYYEDLKKDPFLQIKNIAEFLEVKRSDEEIKEIVSDTSFQSMKNKSGTEVNELLVRKGLVGEWKDQFTVAQSELMDEKVKELLSETDIRFTYEL